MNFEGSNTLTHRGRKKKMFVASSATHTGESSVWDHDDDERLLAFDWATSFSRKTALVQVCVCSSYPKTGFDS